MPAEEGPPNLPPEQTPPAVDPEQPQETVGPPQYAGEDEPGPGASVDVDRLEQSSSAETASDVGEIAVGDNSTQIPVTDGGENPFPDRVQDVEKARVMAKAGDDWRTEAVAYRSMASRVDSGEAIYPSDLEAPKEKSTEYREVALREDQKASKIEEWAGILHDNPVSNDYQKNHPQVNFTPEGLDFIQEHAQLTSQALERLDDEYATAAWGTVVLPEKLHIHAGEIPPESIQPALAELLHNPQATLDQLRLYFKKAEAENLEQSKQWAETVLDDVRSGRASQPPESSETDGVAA